MWLLMILDYVVTEMISKMLKAIMRKSVKQNGEQDRPYFESIGLPLRTILRILSGLYLRVNPSAYLAV